MAAGRVLKILQQRRAAPVAGMVSGVAQRRSILGKMVLGLVALAVLAVLFMRTLQETTTAPYELQPQHLTGWELALDPPLGAQGPLLALTPPRELTLELFNQIFARTMESMAPPAGYAVTLVLRREFSGSLAGVIEPEELLALAREAGLDGATPEPLCVAMQQGRDGGASDRTYFALFDLPALHAFRERLGQLAAERGGAATFDPGALSPALYLAATGPGFRGWPVADAAAAQHCVAPLEVSADS